MNAQERQSWRIPRIRITVIQLFFLLSAVFFAAVIPTPGQFIISAVLVALVGVAMTVTNLRKEPAPPEVFLEEEHFDGGWTIPVKGEALSRMWGSQQVVFSVSPQFRMLVLSPTAGALEFSLGYGLGRFFGPWILKREDVVEIQRVRTWFAPYEGVRALPVAGRPWTFVTREPATVLACLERNLDTRKPPMHSLCGDTVVALGRRLCRIPPADRARHPHQNKESRCECRLHDILFHNARSRRTARRSNQTKWCVRSTISVTSREIAARE